jgi:hypothetical protein
MGGSVEFSGPLATRVPEAPLSHIGLAGTAPPTRGRPPPLPRSRAWPKLLIRVRTVLGKFGLRGL